MIFKNILFFKREYSINQIQRISLYTEYGFLKNSIYVNIRTERGFKKIHLGTLSSDNMQMLYDYLHNNVDCHIEIMNSK